MSQYLDIGVVTFKEYDLPELEPIVHNELHRLGLMWGGGRISVRRKDKSLHILESQHRKQKFAGLWWHDDMNSLLSTATHLLVVGRPGDINTFRQTLRSKLNRYPNLVKFKYIQVI